MFPWDWLTDKHYIYSFCFLLFDVSMFDASAKPLFIARWKVSCSEVTA